MFLLCYLNLIQSFPLIWAWPYATVRVGRTPPPTSFRLGNVKLSAEFPPKCCENGKELVRGSRGVLAPATYILLVLAFLLP